MLNRWHAAALLIWIFVAAVCVGLELTILSFAFSISPGAQAEAFYRAFNWLMLARPDANESHTFSFAVLAALVAFSFWHAYQLNRGKLRRAFKYAVLVGSFVIYYHEVCWWLLYWWFDLPHLPYWYLAVQMGVGFYFLLRVLPGLLKTWKYKVNWKLWAWVMLPLLYWFALWVFLGFPSSVTFYSPGHGVVLLFGQPSPLRNDLLTNSLENGSWLVAAISAAIAVAKDRAKSVPFTIKVRKTTKKRQTHHRTM